MKLASTLAALALSAGSAFAGTYEVTVTNNLDTELFAPIVVTDANNDSKLFTMHYVTKAAESQILTGDPAEVVKSIGADMVSVGHGTDGPPGVLLAPGKSVTFQVETEATALRILAMVAPTEMPDTYVTAVADLYARNMAGVSLDRFDIGHDEGDMMTRMTATSVGTVEIHKM